MIGWLALVALATPEIPVPATDPAVVPIGHIARTPDGALELLWSASEVRVRFTGTAIAVELDDATEPPNPNTFAILIDGQRTDFTAPFGRSVLQLAAGLPAGTHDLRMIKRSEALVGPTRVSRFFIDEGASLLPAPPPTRLIEVVGDSVAAGFGVLGADPSCTFTSFTEDVTRSFAGILAAHLGADLVVVAWSGKGVMRDYAAVVHDDKNPSVPSHYQGAAPLPAGQHPDVVIVSLGANDFSNGVPRRGPFFKAMHGLLDTLRARHPKAWIILHGPQTKRPDDPTVVAQNWLRAIATRRGDGRLSVVDMPMRDDALGFGCLWHPGPRAHEAIARPLEAEIKARLGW